MKKKTLKKVNAVNALMLLGAVILVVFLAMVSISSKPAPEYGNVGGYAYNATTTDSTWVATVGGSKLLKTGSGVLRNIVITNESAGTFNIYDATTTASHADHATTTITKIHASLAEGTYTFDAAFSRGLLIEFQSTNVASSTITWE